MIKCREMTPSDKVFALGLMKNHYGSEFPGDFFPDTGAVCLIDDVIACVILIYFEESSATSVLGHCVINKDFPKRQLCSAVTECIRFGIDICRKNGRKYVVGIFGRNSINRLADKIGFSTADKIEEKYLYIGE